MEAPERIWVSNTDCSICGVKFVNPMKWDKTPPGLTEYVLSPQWRDIDSAPKDGSRFLAFEASEESQRYECWWLCETPNWEGWQTSWDDEPNPTHWMPLPTPPNQHNPHQELKSD